MLKVRDLNEKTNDTKTKLKINESEKLKISKEILDKTRIAYIKNDKIL